MVPRRAAPPPHAPLVHPLLGRYRVIQPPLRPLPGTNVADRVRVAKGDAEAALAAAEVTVEGFYTLPMVAHAAMETRSCRVEILPSGDVHVETTSQAPFEVRRILAETFGLPEGRVHVHVPLVGGAFGGKAAVFLEPIAYLASRAVGGRMVEIVLSREEDMGSAPLGAGVAAAVRLGATRQGLLTAAHVTFVLDAGAYTDSAPRVARAIAADVSGPYRIDHLACDVLTVYTNRTYTTAYRGFGHIATTFAMERTLDRLARAVGRDPWQLRADNALRPGDTTPTGVRLTESRLGDVRQVLTRAAALLPAAVEREGDEGPVRATGVALFWKTSSSPPDAASGAFVSLDPDGSAHLAVGAVETGAGSRTAAAQILAEHLGLDVSAVHVAPDVDTDRDPEHWKTVASLSTFLCGRAVAQAAAAIRHELKRRASVLLHVPEEDLDLVQGRVVVRGDPSLSLPLTSVCHGVTYPEGHALWGQVLGHGSVSMRRLTPLDPETGRGEPGSSWTVGAQAVEVEVDPSRFTYRILRAATVLDVGRLLNPKLAEGVVMGGMAMGLGYATREAVRHSADGRRLNPDLRTYKLLRMGEEPEEYLFDVVATPEEDAPFGARPLGEHGVLGMPAALANALSAALGVDVDTLPLTPETLWRTAGRREVAHVAAGIPLPPAEGAR